MKVDIYKICQISTEGYTDGDEKEVINCY